MTETVLLTLGRLPKCLDIARALHGAGKRVVIAEPFKDHLCRPSKAVAACHRVRSPVETETGYLDDLLDVIEREDAGLVIPVSEEAMYAAGLQARLPADRQLHGPGLVLIRELYDKYRFNRRARSAGLAVPETETLGSAAGAALAERTDVVVKPIYSSSGLGVAFVKRGEALPEMGAQAVVQAQLSGAARNSFSIAHEGRLIGTVVYEGTVMSHTVCVAFRRVEAPDIEAWIARFVAATDYSGFISFDFIDDGAGVPHAIECNPRANSGLHYVTAQSLAAAILSPDRAAGLELRAEDRLQQFFPCFTEAQNAMFKPARRRAIRAEMKRSTDVTWDRTDPWPQILMTWTSREILGRSLTKGMTLGEASVVDIGWRG